MIEWSDIDWGNAPSWLALIAASTAAAFAGRNVLVDQQDRRREQAGKVAAWWGTDPNPGGPMMRRGTPTGAFLRNSSEVPVFDLRLAWLHDGQVVERHTRRVLPPTSTPVFVPIVTLPAAGDQEAADRRATVLAAVAEVEGGLDVRLDFRDASGREWLRSEDGTLKQQHRRWHQRGRGARELEPLTEL